MRVKEKKTWKCLRHQFDVYGISNELIEVTAKIFLKTRELTRIDKEKVKFFSLSTSTIRVNFVM